MAPDEFAVEELAAETCWQLLGSMRVGRLAVVQDARPQIFPINFAVDHQSIVFRTAAGTKLSAARQADVAFEVDDYDESTGTAWSVILGGRATEIVQPDDWADPQELLLFPWHVAPKPHFVRIVPDTVSGRRFRAAYAGPGGFRGGSAR